MFKRCGILSVSRNARPLTERDPSNGLMWVSIRLRSMRSVEALIGRRLRPTMRPASASLRYQSQTSLTVMPAGAAWRSADGFSPSATEVSFLRARSRATSGVRGHVDRALGSRRERAQEVDQRLVHFVGALALDPMAGAVDQHLALESGHRLIELRQRRLARR
jgi:hypothetical protein